jgi:hypothetical protein
MRLLLLPHCRAITSNNPIAPFLFDKEFATIRQCYQQVKVFRRYGFEMESILVAIAAQRIDNEVMACEWQMPDFVR